MNQPLFLFLLALLVLVSVKWVRHKRIYEKYAVLWLAIAIIALIAAVKPEIVGKTARLVGVSLPSNFVFLIGIAILLVLTFQMSFDISKSRKQIEILATEIALLKNDLQERD